MVVVAETKMHDGCRDAVGVWPVRINRHIIAVVGGDLAPTSKGQIARLHSAHLLLESCSITRQDGGLVGEHVTGIVHLKAPSSGVGGLAKEMIVTGHVDVIGRAVLVRGLLPF